MAEVPVWKTTISFMISLTSFVRLITRLMFSMILSLLPSKSNMSHAGTCYISKMSLLVAFRGLQDIKCLKFHVKE